MKLNASSVLNMSETSFNNLWKYYADTMHWAGKVPKMSKIDGTL